MKKIEKKMRKLKHFNENFEIEKVINSLNGDILVDLKSKATLYRENLDIFLKEMYAINKNIVSIQVDNTYTVISDYS